MLIPVLVSLLAVIAFGFALWKSGVVGVAQKAVSTALAGLSTMTDQELDDDAKEVAVRRAAFSLFGAAFSLAVRFAIILAAAAVPVLVADWLNIATVETVLALMLRLDYIIIISVVAIVGAEVLRRVLKQRQMVSVAASDLPASSGYSDVDRFLHGIAFSSPALQRGVSWLEDLILGKPTLPAQGPIFVTSLARGGTTALLNGLSRVPGIATHTYRDMPFLTAPTLWNKLAGGSKRAVVERDRAHGDGLTIGLDSPEAFEEVIWKMYWPQKYASDRGGIEPWAVAERSEAGEAFLARHMAKIVRARFGEAPAATARYCSKNNANIARLNYLPTAFPNSSIVIPLRRPTRHAASLLRQHLNFLKLQEADPFVRRYMRDIGHYEFGQIYRPLQFEGVDPTRYDPTTPDHWLDYWLHAFKAVEKALMGGAALTLVTQDSLRAQPNKTMEKLGAVLGLELGGLDFTNEFLAKPDVGDDRVFSPGLVKETDQLYERLAAQAL